MTNTGNRLASLRNVAALLVLVEKLESRAAGLPGMGTFYGPSGYGKTSAGIVAMNEFQTCLVECKSLWTTKSFLEAVVSELGLRPAKTQASMFSQAAEALARSGRTLIVDEADHLVRGNKIEVVRGLHEEAGVAVVLVGEELLPQKLQMIERVHGRMLDWVAAEPGSIDDVKKLADIYCPGIAIDPTAFSDILTASRASIRRISVNLAAIFEQARLLGLTRIGRAEIAAIRLFSGEAPAPRRIVA